MAQKYELPNGKYIEVEEDFIGSQEEKELLEQFNQKQPTQSAQPIQQNKGRAMSNLCLLCPLLNLPNMMRIKFFRNFLHLTRLKEAECVSTCQY